MLSALFSLTLLATFGFALYSAFTTPSTIRKIILELISVWVIAFLYAGAYYSPLSPQLLTPFQWSMIAALIALALSFIFEKKKN